MKQYLDTLSFVPYKKDGTRLKGVILKRAELLPTLTEVVLEFESAESIEGATAFMKTKPSTSSLTGTNKRLLATSSDPFDSGIIIRGLNLRPG